MTRLTESSAKLTCRSNIPLKQRKNNGYAAVGRVVTESGESQLPKHADFTPTIHVSFQDEREQKWGGRKLEEFIGYRGLTLWVKLLEAYY